MVTPPNYMKIANDLTGNWSLKISVVDIQNENEALHTEMSFINLSSLSLNVFNAHTLTSALVTNAGSLARTQTHTPTHTQIGLRQCSF